MIFKCIFPFWLVGWFCFSDFFFCVCTRSCYFLFTFSILSFFLFATIFPIFSTIFSTIFAIFFLVFIFILFLIIVIFLVFNILENMPMDDRPPGILNHFGPMLLFQLFTAVAKANSSNRIGASNTVIIKYGDLQSNFAQHTLLNHKDKRL